MQAEIILIIDIKMLMREWILKKIKKLKKFYQIRKVWLSRAFNKKTEVYLESTRIFHLMTNLKKKISLD
jgi:hypothetical protein